jgi:hypothetical protein
VSAYSHPKPLQTVTSVVKPLVSVENNNPTKPIYSAGYSAPNQVTDLSSYNESKPIVNLEGYSRVKVPGSVA